jgi:hypothetical protein
MLIRLDLAFCSTLIALLSLSHRTKVHSYPTSQDGAIRVIYQFPNLTALEDVAVRSNGKLLVTLPTAPELYQVDPFNPTKAQLIYRFPNATALIGIAEYEPDTFAVTVGNVTPPHSIPGSYSVWKVDMRSFRSNVNGDILANATVSKFTAIPEATLLNGITPIIPGSPYILISESGLGVVYRVNVYTGEYIASLSSVLMQPPNGTQLGINGIEIFANYLYFVNTLKGFFGRVPIHLFGHEAGTAAGDYEVFVYNGPGDDFTFDRKGNAYIAQNFANGIQLITPEREVRVIAGSVNSTLLESDAACQFGRTDRDRSVLYVVTSGGLSERVPGTYREGGEIIAVDVAKLGVDCGC